MKNALVLGVGGFIGNHLVNALKKGGFWVRGINLKHPEYFEPSNIGSGEMVSINNLAEITIRLPNKNLIIKHIPGSTGVKGRKSDNRFIKKRLGWVLITV